MSDELVVSPLSHPEPDGTVLSITPEKAGWKYVGFQVVKLRKGQRLFRATGEMEVCVVLLSGMGSISTLHGKWEHVGRRMSVFEKIPPYAVYIPEQDQYEVVAETDMELAVCTAPGGGGYPARLISPEDVGVENRGSGNTQRLIHNILPEAEEATSLLVVEVFTPEGHWSSYPPHKHDKDALPVESLLEETYYYRINPDQGYAIQRVYTDDRTLDEALVVKDGQAVLVPKGYHPVSAPPGYELYYLNVMAGPVRTWRFVNDPDHEWLFNRKG